MSTASCTPAYQVAVDGRVAVEAEILLELRICVDLSVVRIDRQPWRGSGDREACSIICTWLKVNMNIDSLTVTRK